MNPVVAEWQNVIFDFTKKNNLLWYDPQCLSSIKISNPDDMVIFDSLSSNVNLLLTKNAIDNADTVAIKGKLKKNYLEFGIKSSTLGKSTESWKIIDSLYDRFHRFSDSPNLYLSYGILHWTNYNGDKIATPIVLQGITMEKLPDGSRVIKKTDSYPFINPALQKEFKLLAGSGLPEFPQKSRNGLEEYYKFLQKGVLKANKNLDWILERNCMISIFNLSPFIVSEDLEKSDTLIDDHYYARRFLRIKTQNAKLVAPTILTGYASTVPVELNDDSFEQLCLIDKADPSELKAILATHAGQSFWLHSPVGTDTIGTEVKIASQLLADKKKVLYISSSKERLNAFYNGVENIGLADYTLKYWSEYASKDSILSLISDDFSLMRDTVASNEIIEEDRKRYINAYKKDSKELMSFFTKLESIKSNTGINGVELLGKYIRESNIPTFKNLSLGSLKNYSNYSDLIKSINDYDDSRKKFLDSKPGLWKDANFTAFSTESRYKFLLNILQTLSQQFAKYQQMSEKLSKEFNITIKNLNELRHMDDFFHTIVDIKIKPEIMFINKLGNINDMIDEMRSLDMDFSRMNELNKEVSCYINPNFYKESIPLEWLEVFLEKADSDDEIEYLKAVRNFKPYLSEAGANLIAYDRLKGKEIISNAFVLKDKTESVVKLFRTLFGEEMQLDVALIENQKQVLAKLFSMKDFFEECVMHERGDYLQILKKAQAAINSFKFDGESYDKMATLLSACLPFTKRFETENMAGVRNVLNALISSFPSWDVVSDYISMQKKSNEYNIPSLDELEIDGYKGDFKLGQIFERTLITKEVRSLVEQADFIKKFSHIDRQYLINDFLANIDGYILCCKDILKNDLYMSRPSLGVDYTQDAYEKLRSYAAEKDKSKISLKEIFNLYDKIIIGKRPLCIFSPVEVSRVLPLRNLFDVIIVDSAENLPAYYSTPGILRSRQLIVVGDEYQMKPNNFLSSLCSNKPSEFIGNIPSTIDAVKQIPNFLNYNLEYQSLMKSEQMVDFSSYMFYSGALKSYPTINIKSDTIGSSIKFIPKCVWDKNTRTNIREAEALVDDFEKMIGEDGFPYSVGIVATTKEQASYIQQVIEERKTKLVNQEGKEYNLPKYFKTEKSKDFYVVSIEEANLLHRDVILFSLTYGPNDRSEMSLALELYCRVDGISMLNSLLTLGSTKFVMYSSFKSTVLETAPNKGVEFLFNVMRYLESENPQQCLLNTTPCVNPEKFITKKDIYYKVSGSIENNGFVIEKNIGRGNAMLPLVVQYLSTGHRFIAFTDDLLDFVNSEETSLLELYFAKPYAISRLGWFARSIWTLDWVRDEVKTEDEVIETINDAERDWVDDDTKEAEKKAKREAGINSVLEDDIDFKTYQLFKPRKNVPVKAQLKQLIMLESPVSINYLLSRTSSIWFPTARDLKTAKAQLNDVIDEIMAEPSHPYDLRDEFLWDRRKELVFRIPLFNSQKPRSFDEVAIEEVEEGIKFIVKEVPSIKNDSSKLISLICEKMKWDKSDTVIRNTLTKKFSEIFSAEKNGKKKKK